MLINKNTKITSKNVILIPYRKEHVPKYHNWMKSEVLQKLTASKPLTLNEEYDMQQSWLNDVNKCTFIILDKKKFESTNNEIESMIGDTNLFFMDSENTSVAEVEIMIAENWAKGRHCGWEAALLMMVYGITYLNVKHYVAKILLDNIISIKMFEKMGFTQTSTSLVFNEVTMERIVDNDWLKMAKDSISPYVVENYTTGQ